MSQDVADYRLPFFSISVIKVFVIENLWVDLYQRLLPGHTYLILLISVALVPPVVSGS